MQGRYWRLELQLEFPTVQVLRRRDAEVGLEVVLPGTQDLIERILVRGLSADCQCGYNDGSCGSSVTDTKTQNCIDRIRGLSADCNCSHNDGSCCSYVTDTSTRNCIDRIRGLSADCKCSHNDGSCFKSVTNSAKWNLIDRLLACGLSANYECFLQ